MDSILSFIPALIAPTLPVLIPIILISILVFGVITFITVMCRTDRLPPQLKFLCLGEIAGQLEAPSETALCDNPLYRERNPSICQNVEDALYNTCVSDMRKNEIIAMVTEEERTAAIAEELSNLHKEGVFLSKDGTRCLRCSGGYSRSLAFGEDTEKACSNVVSPILITGEEQAEEGDKDAVLRGEKNLFQLCKNVYPVSTAYEAAQVAVGTNKCYSCPRGYQKKILSRLGSGQECKPETGSGLLCGGAGRFRGPGDPARPLLTIAQGCYKCPVGFSENLFVTKMSSPQARIPLFYERGCINRTVGTEETPFKSAEEYVIV